MNKIKLPAEILTVELSNICNARCRWCTTGIRNRSGQAPKACFMTPELFERGIDRLLALKWVDEKTTVEPFSWGEPFLNPHMEEILRVIVGKGLRFYLSTNGSIYRKLPPEVIQNMDFLMISLPGVSQASYDKIHQLDAKAVRANITRFAQDLAEAGAPNKLLINFHVYQFNLKEIEAARIFTERLGGTFLPRIAYFADYQLCQQFLRREMALPDLYEAAGQLFMDFYRPGPAETGYECPLWSHLVFDERFNLIPCDRQTSENAVGNLFADPPEQLLQAWRDFAECRACLSSGQGYIIPNTPLPVWYNNILYPKLKHAEQVQKVLEIREQQLAQVDAARAHAEELLHLHEAALQTKEEQLQMVNEAKAHAEELLHLHEVALQAKEEQSQAVNATEARIEEQLLELSTANTYVEEQRLSIPREQQPHNNASTTASSKLTWKLWKRWRQK